MTARGAIQTKNTASRLAGSKKVLRPRERCRARAASGDPCKAPPLYGTKHCAFHTKGVAVLCGQRGGRRRAIFNPDGLEPMKAPTNPGELLLLLSQTIVEVRSAKIDNRTANSIAQLGTSFLRAVEVADMDARLRTLEQRNAARLKMREARPGG